MRRFTVWVIGMQLGEGVKFSDGHIVVYWYKRPAVTEYTDMIELVMDSYTIRWLDADKDCKECDCDGEVADSRYPYDENWGLVPCPACCNPLGRPLKEGEVLP